MKMERVRYALPIQRGSLEEAASVVERYAEEYAIFELWLDLLEGVEVGALCEMATRWPERLLLLTRSPQGRPMMRGFQERCALLSSLAGAEVLIDLDIVTQAAEIRWLQQEGLCLPLLLSFHDYERTPEDTEITAILEQMESLQPKIRKVATYCQSPKDALRLLGWLLRLREEGREAIFLGMGEHGVLTRIASAMWGGAFQFAPLDRAMSSAAGQLTRQRMAAILQLLSSE